MIDWEGPSTETLLNPRLPAGEVARIHALVHRAGPLRAHLWLVTSGSTDRLKPVALPKSGLLASAGAVNRHLAATARDVWLNPLPTFHVGGLGIEARARLTGAKVAALGPWSVPRFAAALTEGSVTLTALVPTQVFDLVQAGVRPPASLRAVVVGGGALDPGLYARARALGWPLLPSYGATECASQAATAPLDTLDRDTFPALTLLPHVEARVAAGGELELKGASLFTGYATERGLDDPKREGWWRTGDVGAVAGRTLTVTGRTEDVVKVLGEVVSLGALQAVLDAVRADLGAPGDAAVVALPDPRAGARLRLYHTGPATEGARLRDAFNRRVAPYERVTEVEAAPTIPRTELGKVRRVELKR